MTQKGIPIITTYGTMWPRNEKNIKDIPGRKDGGIGICLRWQRQHPAKNHQSRAKQDKGPTVGPV